MSAAPSDRLQRALRSLEGLSVGDAFGQQFFQFEPFAATRELPPSPWYFTDDTVMALSIVEVLRRHGRVEQDELAQRFAERYAEEPTRGYGGTAHAILRAIGEGHPWRTVAPAAFDGQGSMGNGAAMRAGPVGAYFADDLDAAVENARASAEVTHAHPDAQAGAIAIAVAAALASRLQAERGQDFLRAVIARTPNSLTRSGLLTALDIPLEHPVNRAARLLGTGSRVVSYDTVPFAVWCAARHLDSFEEAMWSTVSGLGDRDTTCAIVGSIVVVATGHGAIPAPWLGAREALPEGLSP